MSNAPVPTATSETNAETGCVVVEDVPISQAIAWLEDGVYIVRSTEFDLLAEDEDFSEALSLFIDRAADYATALSELISSHEATEDEGRLAGILSRRLIAAFMAAEERRRRERRRRGLFQRRGPRAGHWRHRETQAGSSTHLSPA
jgi:hypothetical protein